MCVLVDRAICLKRALGNHAAQQLKLEQDFLVIVRNIAGGFETVLDHLDAALPSLVKGAFENTSHEVAVSTVHTEQFIDKSLTNQKSPFLSAQNPRYRLLP